MSSTEREALDAGDTWWETELFRGRPDWRQLLDFQYTSLTEAEQSFLDHEVREVCALMDDWKADFEDRDLPPEVWKVLKEKKFFAMLIEPEHGGLGFSSLAQSAVVTRLATRSISLAVTVMVPNSLGPGELLQKYGTEAQKADWLPRWPQATRSRASVSPVPRRVPMPPRCRIPAWSATASTRVARCSGSASISRSAGSPWHRSPR
jgi:Acyl-CoA dehydrogenases